MSILLSAYYSHKKTHSTEDWSRLSEQRELLQHSSFAEGLLLTLAFLNSHQFSPRTAGPFLALQQWNYNDKQITTIRMEDAVTDPAAFLNHFLQLSGLQHLALPDTRQFLFERFTGRETGEVDNSSHYRSGNPNAWRTELPKFIVKYMRDEFHSFLERFYPDSLQDSDDL